MDTKSGEEVLKCFTKFMWMFERQHSSKLKRIHTDNGGEYNNTDLDTLCQSLGVFHTLTAPYNPQSSGVSERINRTLMEKISRYDRGIKFRRTILG